MNLARALTKAQNRVILADLNSNIGSSHLILGIDDINYFEKRKRSRLDRLINRIFQVFRYLGFLHRLKNVIVKSTIKKDLIFVLYPSSYALFDFCSLFYLKYLNGFRLFYEVNELRRSYLVNRSLSDNIPVRWIELIKNYSDGLLYKFHEHYTRYYTGLLVISSGLESYYQKYNKNTLRIPILASDRPSSVSNSVLLTPGEPFKICLSGSLNYKKEGLDILFKSLNLVQSCYPNIELHLIGPIPKNEEPLILFKLPTELGIKKILYYHGIMKQNDVLNELRKYHLLILPRPLNLQTQFGFSTKLAEYLMSGVPVLVTDVSDNSLFIKDGFNGYIIPPGDSIIMSDKIIEIINDYNSSKLNTLIVNQLETVRKNFYFGNYSNLLNNFLN